MQLHLQFGEPQLAAVAVAVALSCSNQPDTTPMQLRYAAPMGLYVQTPVYLDTGFDGPFEHNPGHRSR
jgi:hypothetical protein